MEGGMPTGMGGGADADAPPIGEFWMMDGEGGSSGGSDTGDGMGEGMGVGMQMQYDLGNDFWLQGSESSWSPNGDAASHDSDSDVSWGGSGGYSSESEAFVRAGGGAPGQFDMGLGESTGASSDLDGSDASSSNENSAWPDLGSWVSMPPGDTDSLSSDSYEFDSVPPPAIGVVAHAQPIGAPDSWVVRSANPAAQPKRGPSAGGYAPAKRARRPSAAAAIAAPAVATDPAQLMTLLVPGGSMPPGQSLRWEEALHLLNYGRVVPRPAHLMLMPGSDQQLFLERPMQKRKKGDDKWVGSGGQKGSTHYWMGDVGVRKRYGRVTCDAPEASPLKYAHYTRLRRETSATDATVQALEDKSVALYVAIPEPLPSVDQRPGTRGVAAPAAIVFPDGRASNTGGSSTETGAPASAAAAPIPLPHDPPPRPARAQDLPARVVPAPHVFTAAAGDDNAAALTVQAGANGRFISFRDASGTGPDQDRELGAFVRAKNGVKLVSSQGDFAEWHRRKDGEAPFEGGDVVGFHNGTISRVIHPRASMLGVVSRMAVIEGSLPPQEVRHLYDTVAYTGVVPVKLRMQPPPKPEDFYTGAVLRPSGYNDGTAVLVPRQKLVEEAEMRGTYAGIAAGRVGVVLGCTDGGSELETAPLVPGPHGGYKLVTALVVNPTETVPLPQACCDRWLQRIGDLLWGLIAIVAAMLVVLTLRLLGWISLPNYLLIGQSSP